MKIGISGGSGIGKTTLAIELASNLGIELIPEFVREWLYERDLDNLLDLSLKLQIELQTYYLKNKINFETRIPSFVSDRTVIDGIIITNQRIAKHSIKGEIKTLLSRAETHARKVYDLIIIPPFTNYDDQDTIRFKDINKRRTQHFLIIEYLKKNNIKYFEVPKNRYFIPHIEQLIKTKFG